jgi:antitoxin component of MazEF toxin-antitoxin module
MGSGFLLYNQVLPDQLVVVTKCKMCLYCIMTKNIRPGIFRNHGRALALTIPADYVREMGLVAGDTALFKREPDGLRLRIVRHSTLVELANTQEPTGQNCPVEEEAPVAAEAS